jgi:hypothetical protein
LESLDAELCVWWFCIALSTDMLIMCCDDIVKAFAELVVDETLTLVKVAGRLSGMLLLTVTGRGPLSAIRDLSISELMWSTTDLLSLGKGIVFGSELRPSDPEPAPLAPGLEPRESGRALGS